MKLRYIVIAVVAIGVVARMIGSRDKVITAQDIADEAHSKLQFPVDMGGGMRLDAIRAEGNDLISDTTLLDWNEWPVSAAARDVLETASRSDVCREIQSQKQAAAEAGLRFVRNYRDAKGRELVSVRVNPAEC